MWPAAARRLCLEEIRGLTRIDAVARVASPDVVRSPRSGRMAAFARIEVVEAPPGRERAPISLGAIVLGDVVRLELEADEAPVLLDLLPRRAEIRLVVEPPALPIERVIPEVVPLLARAKRGGALCHRERLFVRGERLRLVAVVERDHRSEVAERLVVRDDIAPVRLDEVAS